MLQLPSFKYRVCWSRTFQNPFQQPGKLSRICHRMFHHSDLPAMKSNTNSHWNLIISKKPSGNQLGDKESSSIQSESMPKGNSLPKQSSESTEQRPYPGSLHRHQRGSERARAQFRSMLDVEEAPSLEKISMDHQESMELWVADKLQQASKNYSTTSHDWADILPLYTATNGAPMAPTRQSPIPNGAPSSPLEIPMTVSSTDPKIAAQQASDMKNIVRRKLTGYVGFANLPNQWHRKSVRKGFNFNVMVVGTCKLRNIYFLV